MNAKHLDDPAVTSCSRLLPKVSVSARLACTAYLMAGTLALSFPAFAQTNAQTKDKIIPDAQVEANVLRALAGAPELAGEDIHTQTVYGVVSLTGSVRNEVLQTRAENLAANISGVKKVVDELRVEVPTREASAPKPAIPASNPASPGQAAAKSAETPEPLPGSAPASTAVMNDPERDQQQYQQQDQQTTSRQQAQPAGDPTSQQSPNAQQPYGDAGGQPGYGRRPMQSNPAYAGAPEYGQYPGNQRDQSRQGQPPQGSNRYPRYGSERPGGYQQQGVYGGQQAGKAVVIPDGTMIRVRLNQSVSSNRSTPGSSFDATVESDVVANDTVAIPRGAQVSGTVVDATRAGVLKGRGDLTMTLNSVALGGHVFPLVTRPWSHHGGDKTLETVNKTAGFGAAGAVLGALAGGGEGAAVGGGIGAAAGLGSSATSGRGQVYVPAEAVVTFRLAEQAPVTTVSEQEMQRLAYAAVPAPRPHYPRRHYPPVYIAPAYYPGYYPGYYRPFPGSYPGYYPGPYGFPSY